MCGWGKREKTPTVSPQNVKLILLVETKLQKNVFEKKLNCELCPKLKNYFPWWGREKCGFEWGVRGGVWVEWTVVYLCRCWSFGRDLNFKLSHQNSKFNS